MKYIICTLLLLLSTGCCTFDKNYHPVVCQSTKCSDKNYEIALHEQYLKKYSVIMDGWGATINPGNDHKINYHVGDKDSTNPNRKINLAFLEYLETAKSTPNSDQLKENKHSVQLEAIKYSLKKSHSLGNPVYLVVYVHGWHNNGCRFYEGDANNNLNTECQNADETTDDVKGFEALLVRRAYELIKAGYPHDVLGVYVGWRGENSFGTNVFSIINRAGAADKLGRYSTLRKDLETIYSLIEANKDIRMLIMGHSLGGRILSRAFIENPYALNKPYLSDNQCYQPLGEQAYFVTINPAIEAAPFNAMQHDLRNSNCKAYPHWINITSTDDYTTDSLFYLASFFGASAHSYSSEWLTAIGHYDEFISHDLNTLTSDRNCNGDSKINELKDFFDLSSSSPNIKEINYSPVDLKEDCHYKTKIRARNSMEFHPKPIWNISTNNTIIDSEWGEMFGVHNAFVQTNLGKLIDGLVFHDLTPNLKKEASERNKL